jgi:hypothetical protein
MAAIANKDRERLRAEADLGPDVAKVIEAIRATEAAYAECHRAIQLVDLVIKQSNRYELVRKDIVAVKKRILKLHGKLFHQGLSTIKSQLKEKADDTPSAHANLVALTTALHDSSCFINDELQKVLKLAVTQKRISRLTCIKAEVFELEQETACIVETTEYMMGDAEQPGEAEAEDDEADEDYAADESDCSEESDIPF